MLDLLAQIEHRDLIEDVQTGRAPIEDIVSEVYRRLKDVE